MSRAPATRLSTLTRWHRRVATFAFLAVISWSLSGALHPLLARYQPQPAQRLAPPVGPLAGGPALASILAMQGVLTVIDCRLVQWPAGQFWQIRRSALGVPQYFATDDGEELVDGDAQYAVFLARHFLGDASSETGTVTRVSAFGGEYAYVNRLLPVYRVGFDRDDGMRVYVDTANSLLATLVDDRKAVFNWMFTTFHTWHLGTHHDKIRVPVALLFLSATLLTPLLGFLLHRAHRKPVRAGGWRRTHRRLGLVVAFVITCSAGSGTYHLVKGAFDRAQAPPGPIRANEVNPVAGLDTTRLALGTMMQELRLVNLDGHWVARVLPLKRNGHGPIAHHGTGVAPTAAPANYIPLRDNVSADYRLELFDDRRYVRVLAAHFTGLDATQFQAIERIETFSGEYGFINKFLPVYRVHLTNGARLYLHVETATFAARVDTGDLVEGWTFANLHKWQAFDGLGRWPRDLIQISFALSSALVALIGLILLRR